MLEYGAKKTSGEEQGDMLVYSAKQRLGKNKAICWNTALKTSGKEQGDMLEYGAKKRLGKNKAICWYTALKNVWGRTRRYAGIRR